MRSSDRWLTPGVLVTLILCGTLCVLATLAGVTYLTERGIDPDPMLKLVGLCVTAVGSLGSFVVNLVNRRTTTKVERNTGILTSAVDDLADVMTRPAPARHAYPPHTVAMQSAAPGPRGE